MGRCPWVLVLPRESICLACAWDGSGAAPHTARSAELASASVALGALPGNGGVMEPGLMMGGPLGPMGLMAGPMGLLAGPLAAGGLAVIRIRLLPDAGSPSDAVLQVNCAKGKVPEDRPNDAVRLAITGGPEFDEQLGGRTVFLLRRPGPNFAWKQVPRSHVN